MHLFTLLTSFFLLVLLDTPSTHAAAVPDTSHADAALANASFADTSLTDTSFANAPLPADLLALHPAAKLGGVVHVAKSHPRDSIPSECVFEKPGIDYYYVRITGLAEGTACFGFRNFPPACNGKPWKDPDWSNIQSAMGQQLTKKGVLKTTTVGHWTASWNTIVALGGFKSDAAVLFDFAFWVTASKIGSVRWYYFSRDYKFANVQVSPSHALDACNNQ